MQAGGDRGVSLALGHFAKHFDFAFAEQPQWRLGLACSVIDETLDHARVHHRSPRSDLTQCVQQLVQLADSRLQQIAKARSEEHTSELQSHVNLVCRLLLEKKKERNKLNNSLNGYTN